MNKNSECDLREAGEKHWRRETYLPVLKSASRKNRSLVRASFYWSQAAYNWTWVRVWSIKSFRMPVSSAVYVGSATLLEKSHVKRMIGRVEFLLYESKVRHSRVINIAIVVIAVARSKVAPRGSDTSVKIY